MAKKYHPDFLMSDGVSEKEREEASEMFKKIQKAYEVLGNPISRQAYDIENNITAGGDTPEDSSRYEDTTSSKSYYQPKQQRDFYYTKWTDYKQPDWYHPYNGLDARSEFLYFRKNAISWPRIDQIYDWIENNRFETYLIIFALINAVQALLYFRRKKQFDLELDLLNTSF